MKIKWNDDRVNAAATALLLIARARLAAGGANDGNLVAEALAEFRADPVGYKENRKFWPDARDLAPLKVAREAARYQALLAGVDRLLAQWTKTKRQFNSLRELDNALVEQLEDAPSREAGSGAK